LIIALGPTALDLIQKLAAIWSKPSLTVDEVVALCAPAKKSYDDYIAEAKAALLQDSVVIGRGTILETCPPVCECNPSVPLEVQPVADTPPAPVVTDPTAGPV
jgi:hypothetical protein